MVTSPFQSFSYVEAARKTASAKIGVKSGERRQLIKPHEEVKWLLWAKYSWGCYKLFDDRVMVAKIRLTRTVRPDITSYSSSGSFVTLVRKLP